MTEEFESFSDENRSKFSIKDYLSRYLTYWPFFIVSLLICIGAASFYIRYAIPKYMASTLVIIKGKAVADRENDLVESAVNGQLKPDFNIVYEQQLIRSIELIERVVTKRGFNIDYYLEGKIRKTNVYTDAPFRLIMQNQSDTTNILNFNIKGLTNKGGVIEFVTDTLTKSFRFKWNQPFKEKDQFYTLTPKSVNQSATAKYSVTWKPVKLAAADIKDGVTVVPFGKTAGIFSLAIESENVKQAQDILDEIVKEYNILDIEERNLISNNTIRFIDERLNLVTNELNGVEGGLEKYQGQNRGVDLGAQSAQSLGNSNNVSQNLTTINVKSNVVEMIRTYFDNPSTYDKLVPSTLGLEDPTLAALISKYNDLQLTKQRETPLVAPNSTVMEDLNNQINSVRGNIIESLQNISKNLKLQETNLQAQNAQYNQFLSSLPHKERVMQEMKRKQSITEGLYLYLLQKREESAISSASSNVSNYKQIEPAVGYGPVEPNKTNIMLFAGFLGVLIPFGWITAKIFLNEEVLTRNDITNKLSLPIYGDIYHQLTTSAGIENLSVFTRDAVSEQLRIVRTNLEFALKNKDNKVILITSSVSEEGKSFISLNLAAALAIPGRKVALLEFDLRKPTIADKLSIKNDTGISTFLEKEVKDLSTVYKSFDKIPSLHIFLTGPIHTNPGDMLLNKKISSFFNQLRSEYDYIIIDSPPTGLVSDAYILGRYSNAVLYIIRQRVTTKTQLNYIKDIVETQKLNNIGIVFNDIKTGAKYGYQGYGFGVGYEEYENTKKSKKSKSS